MIATAQIGKKIGIYGLAKMGRLVYQSVESVADKVVCFDDSDKIIDQFLALFPAAKQAQYTDKAWQNLDLIVLCESLPRRHPLFGFADKYDIEIVSDLQIFLDQVPSAKLIGITGTNGKSTTLALIEHILKITDLNYLVGGNNNTPMLELIDSAEGYIFDLNSCQLDLLKQDFEAHISLLLNVEPGQLGRHSNYQEYSRSKEKIISLGKNSTSIIGVDSVFAKNLYRKYLNLDCKQLISISGFEEQENGVYCDSRRIVDNYFEKASFDFSCADCLVGKHNRQNIAAAYTICRSLGVPAATILESIKGFKGLPHRMELVAKIGNIVFYNDSKAINASATAMSLSSLQNIRWIAGGELKEDNLDKLTQKASNVTKAYLYGKDRKKLARVIDGKIKYSLFEDLEQATKKAFEDTILDNFTGESDRADIQVNILLSPSCHPSDQFQNYEERGKLFSDLALKFMTRTIDELENLHISM